MTTLNLRGFMLGLLVGQALAFSASGPAFQPCLPQKACRLPLRHTPGTHSRVGHVQIAAGFPGFGGMGDMFKGIGGGDTEVEDLENFQLSTVSLGRQPTSAFATIPGRAQGREKINQDSGVAILDLKDEINLVAVFDGHGENGELVAEFLSQNLPTTLLAYFDSEDWEGYSPSAVVPSCFQLLDQMVTDNVGQRKLRASGATATVVLHRGNSMLVGCCGDSRAVLGSGGGKPRAITTAHNPAEPAERARIEASGGEVGVFDGEPTVEQTGMGRVFVAGKQEPGLATARAFGDLLGKSCGVTAEPEIFALNNVKQRQVLIVASDGVWDVVDDESAVRLAMEYAQNQDAQSAADVLVQEARMLWEQRPGSERTIDDISASVTFF